MTESKNVNENPISSTYKTIPSLKDISYFHSKCYNGIYPSSRSVPGQQAKQQLLIISKTQKILNEFKQTLKETDALTQQLSYESCGNLTLPISHSLNLNSIDNNTNNNNFDNVDDGSSSLERLKISNEVLIKANIDLKNKNKILTNEITQYKNSAIYTSPYSQFDQNVNKFIQDLKTSLENAQLSNQELIKTVNHTNSQSDKLAKANNELIQNFELIKKEYENAIKENSELKAVLLNKNDTVNDLNSKIDKLNEKISELENSLYTNEKQINYLNTINSSSEQMQKDTETVILNLKSTIENLQKSNIQHIARANEINQKFNGINEILNTKNVQIEQCKKEVELKEKENKDILVKIENLENNFSEIKTQITQHKNEMQKEIFEKEKLKTQIETMQVFLRDREKTIQNLKNSMMFLTKTFDNDLISISGNKNEESVSQNKSQKKIKTIKDNSNKIVTNLQKTISSLKDSNSLLMKEKEKLQSEINEYAERFEESKYQYQNLYQKFREQNSLIETLKKEFLEKRKDKDLIELIKANEEIMNKLNKIQEENQQKTKELNELKTKYNKINSQLMENQKKLLQEKDLYQDIYLKKSHTTPNYTMNKFGVEINDLEDSQSEELSRRLNYNNITNNK